jgi:4'-phosphopantetheinyl transferase
VSATLVHVVDLASCPGQERCAALLDAAERSRLARFATAELRRRFAARRWALRRLLAAARAIPPAQVALAVEPGGRPRWADGGGPWFSASHRGDVALVAISDEPVGVDVEAARTPMDPLPVDGFAADERAWLAAHPGQGPFLRLWTAKEAYLKARGVGLREPLDASSLIPGEHAVALARAGDGDRDWLIAHLDLDLGTDVVACCCRRPGGEVTVVDPGQTGASLAS